MKQISEDKIIELLREFKAKGAWSGTVQQRKEKFLDLFTKLSEATEIDQDGWHLVFEVDDKISNWRDSGESSVNHLFKVMTLRGRLSVTTFLHEFAHIYLGREVSHETVQSFAIYYFGIVFPEQLARLKQNSVTGMLKKL